MAVIDYTGGEASAFTAEIWEKKAQGAFLAGLIVSKEGVISLIMTDKTRGDIAHVATMPALVANDVTVATGVISPQASTVTDTSITLNKTKEVSVEVTQEVMDKAFLDVMQKFSEQF